MRAYICIMYACMYVLFNPDNKMDSNIRSTLKMAPGSINSLITENKARLELEEMSSGFHEQHTCWRITHVPVKTMAVTISIM